MRTFFALPIEETAGRRIHAWRSRNLLCDGRPVPPENFHITLCFLGQTSETQLSSVADAADTVSANAFDLHLDETGYFPKPKVLWIGPSRVPDALGTLGGRLTRIAARAGLQVDKRPFQPHLTLMRKCRDPALSDAEPPDVALRCDRFSLYESRSTAHGVRYIPLATWPLNTDQELPAR